MKKIVFVFILLLVSTVSFADNGNGTTPVVMNGESVSGHNRNGFVLPK